MLNAGHMLAVLQVCNTLQNGATKCALKHVFLTSFFLTCWCTYNPHGGQGRGRVGEGGSSNRQEDALGQVRLTYACTPDVCCQHHHNQLFDFAHTADKSYAGESQAYSKLARVRLILLLSMLWHEWRPGSCGSMQHGSGSIMCGCMHVANEPADWEGHL